MIKYVFKLTGSSLEEESDRERLHGVPRQVVPHEGHLEIRTAGELSHYSPLVVLHQRHGSCSDGDALGSSTGDVV